MTPPHKNSRYTPTKSGFVLSVLVVSVLLLSAWLLAEPVIRQSFSDQYTGEADRGGILFVSAPDDVASYELHQQVLAQTGGFSSLNVPLKESELPGEAIDKILSACRRLSAIADCSMEDIWIVSSGSVISDIGPLTLLDFAGLILFINDDSSTERILDQGNLMDLQRPLLMIADHKQQYADELFEHLTGEEAVFFPVEQSISESDQLVYQSADGLTRLVISRVSPWPGPLNRISSVVIGEMFAWIHSYEDATVSHELIVRAQANLLSRLYRLVLSVLLLLLVPAAALLMKRIRTEEPANQAISIWGEGLIWLTAFLVALLITLIINRLFSVPISWPAGLLLFSPGIHGWFHFGWQNSANSRVTGSPVKKPPVLRLAIGLGIALLTGGILTLNLSFLSLSTALKTNRVLLVFLIVLGIGLGFTGLTGQSDRLIDVFMNWLRRRIVFLLVPILFFSVGHSQSGWLALLAFVWMIWVDWFAAFIQQISQSRILSGLAASLCLMPLLISLLINR